MNKTQEALKMAIEVMEEGFGTLECEGMLPHRYQKAIQSCKEALAELQAHDYEVIEKCANVCENNDGSWADYIWNEAVNNCARQIRALKT